jgi:hypothetical protein
VTSSVWWQSSWLQASLVRGMLEEYVCCTSQHGALLPADASGGPTSRRLGWSYQQAPRVVLPADLKWSYQQTPRVVLPADASGGCHSPTVANIPLFHPDDATYPDDVPYPDDVTHQHRYPAFENLIATPSSTVLIAHADPSPTPALFVQAATKPTPDDVLESRAADGAINRTSRDGAINRTSRDGAINRTLASSSVLVFCK